MWCIGRSQGGLYITQLHRLYLGKSCHITELINSYFKNSNLKFIRRPIYMLNLIKELKVKVGFLGARGGQSPPSSPHATRTQKYPAGDRVKGHGHLSSTS